MVLERGKERETETEIERQREIDGHQGIDWVASCTLSDLGLNPNLVCALTEN